MEETKDFEALSKGLQLTPKVRAFIRCYDGDVYNSMVQAGFSGDRRSLETYGRQLLSQDRVQAAIRELAKLKASEVSYIAKKEEMQAFLTHTMRNEDPNFKQYVNKEGIVVSEENIPMSNRLKAVELLGKSQGIYSENVNITGSVSIMDVVKKASLGLDDDDTPIDVIEAEYERLQSNKNSEDRVDPFFDPDEGLI